MRITHRQIAFVLLGLGLGLAGCGLTQGKTTIQRATVHEDYTEGTRTTDEAQHVARAACGEAEAMSVTSPALLEDGRYRVTATCMATYDDKGILIPNET